MRPRSSVGGGNLNRSSIGCSSLIPRTPHTPRGLLRNVLSVFPVMEEAAAKTETFFVSSVIPEDGSQADVFHSLLPDVQAVTEGFNASVLTYGVAQSGKSYTLWGTEEDKGLAYRAVQYLFVHAPEGSKFGVSFVGLDDNTFLNYLDADCKDEVEGLSEVVPRDVEDASSAWETIEEGLSRMQTVDRHQILTIFVKSPSKGAMVTGSLQLAEITLPGAQDPMTRNISALHDMVRQLQDNKRKANHCDTLLTSALQETFGGNCRTTVLLNLHPTLDHYHHNIQTLSFGEHCIKLKNRVIRNTDEEASAQGRRSPRLSSAKAVSATPKASTKPSVVRRTSMAAPAKLKAAPGTNEELVNQINDYQEYASELEKENDDLRNLVRAWEARHEQKGASDLELRVAELETENRNLAMDLEAEKVVTNGQLLIIARQEAILGKLKIVESSLAEEDMKPIEVLVSKVQELEHKLGEANRKLKNPDLEEFQYDPSNVVQRLRLLESENEALKRSLSSQRESLVADEISISDLSARNQHDRLNTLLAKKDAQLRDMKQEMKLKEEEMVDRENEMGEMHETITFLRSQLNTMNFLKASSTNINHRTQAPRAPKSQATDVRKIDHGAAKSKAREIADAKRRKRQAEIEEAERKAEEEAERAERKAEERRLAREITERKKREAAEKKAREAAEKKAREAEKKAREAEKRAREAEKKARQAERRALEMEQQNQMQEEEVQQEEEEEEEEQEEEQVVKKTRGKKRSGSKRKNDVEEEEEVEEIMEEEKAQEEEVEEEEEEVEQEKPKQQQKRSKKKQASAARSPIIFQPDPHADEEQPIEMVPVSPPVPLEEEDDALESPMPGLTPAPATKARGAKKSASKKKGSRKRTAASPNENDVQVMVPEEENRAGRKKLYDGKDKKRGKQGFRKSLVPTPQSVAAPKRGKAALDKFDGMDNYKGMLEELLDNDIYALNTPAK